MLMSADDDWYSNRKSKQLFIRFWWNKNYSKLSYLVEEKAYMRTA